MDISAPWSFWHHGQNSPKGNASHKVQTRTEKTQENARLKCCACLSKERRLIKLCNVPDGVNVLHFLLCYYDCKAAANKEELSKMRICWECSAVLLRIISFMRQAREAQILLAQVNVEKCFSSLDYYHKAGYDSTIECDTLKLDTSDNLVDFGTATCSLVKSENEDHSDDSVADAKGCSDPDSDDDNIRYQLLEFTSTEPCKIETLDHSTGTPQTLDSCKVTLTNLDHCYAPHDETSIINLKNKSQNEKHIYDVFISDQPTAFTEDITPTSDKIREYPKLRSKHKPLNHGIGCPCVNCPTHYYYDNSEKKSFMCDLCGKEVATLRNLETHRSAHKQCSVCDTIVTGTQELQKHNRQFHNPKKGALCNICGKGFDNEHRLNSHKLTHRPLTCESCNRDFSNKRQLRYHLKMHHATKRFKCTQCSITFTIHAHLRKHEQTHNIDSKFECDICKKTFTQKAYLHLHVRRVHRSHERKIFTCDICQKNFREKAHLVLHLAYHSSVKPYLCDKCHKQFKKKSSLVAHREIHRVNSKAH